MVELMSFSQNEVNERISNEELTITSDNYGQLAMSTVIKPGLMAKGGDRYDVDSPGVCRGNFPSDYSILIKFSYKKEKISFNFLNITDQLTVTLDNCDQNQPQLVVNFPSCLTSLTNSLNIESGEYHKIGIQVRNGTLSVYFDCIKLVNDVAINDNCRVQCDKEVDVHMMQPDVSSSCNSAAEKVREMCNILSVLIIRMFVLQVNVKVSQLAFVPDPPEGADLDTYYAPAAQGLCYEDGAFNIDNCGEEVKPADIPEAQKQGGVVLATNITDIVS